MKALYGIPTEQNPKASYYWRAGRRYYSKSRADNAGKPVTVECDLLQWDSPDGTLLLIGLVVPCAQCAFPIMVKGDDATCGVSDGRLTLRFVLQCPAHWVRTNKSGNVQYDYETQKAKRLRCGWTALITDGVAHHPECQGSGPGADHMCDCGARIDAYEAAQEAR